LAGANADKTCALVLALAIVAALRHAENMGQGRRIEVPMFETMVSFNLAEHLYRRNFIPPLGEAKYPRIISKLCKPYRTLDGYLAVMPYNDR